MEYGAPPLHLGQNEIDLPEVMYYLYLPVMMEYENDIRLPPNVACCHSMIEDALHHIRLYGGWRKRYRYAYLSARKGYATPDNPLNRPGWHTDGFGTDDMNFVWWAGPGTRFAVQPFEAISADHIRSQEQFAEQVKPGAIVTYPERGLYAINPSVVHATPLIEPPGRMRQYVKISLSDHRYNLENNSHNYLFDYDWPLTPRNEMRNDPYRAQRDYARRET